LERPRRNSDNGQVMHLILIILFLFLSVALIIKGCAGSENNKKDNAGIIPPAADHPDLLPEQSNDPQVVASASIGITGNLFMQDEIIESAATNSGSYDFSEGFSYIANSYQSFDFMIANLETTLGGTDAGEYTGTNAFNCPDELIDALKNAGVDMLLTSNNHSYDTGHNGFIRTQEVLNQKGMLYTGSRLSTDTANYIVQNINGIKVGMMCYTHETGDTAEGNKTINDNTVAVEDTDLINSFNYRQMDQFYTEVENAKTAMEAEGAEFILFFIHWGKQYDLTPSNTQKKIAQNLCELGIDIIIGSHPHTVQPVQLLTSESGENTYCVYSVGNAISSERRNKIGQLPNGHTEDGIIFGVEFQRWSDGTVKISDMNITPLWVSQETAEEKSQYFVLPVDVSYNFYPSLSTFADSVNSVVDPDREPTNIEFYTPSDPTQISASYTRTMDIVLTGLTECRQALGLTPVSNVSGN